jgi:hypothetical protein
MPTYLGNQQYYDIRLGTQSIGNIIQPPAYVVSGSTLILNGSQSYPGSGTTWIDVSGNGNNGTLTNPGPDYSTANGGYFDFPNDQSKYITVAQSTSLNNTFVSDFTFDIWFTIDAFAGGSNDNCSLFGKSYLTENPGLGIIVNRNTNTTPRGEVKVYANGTDLGAFSTKLTLTTGGWVNLQIVRSGSTITGYQNTVSIGTKTNSSNLSNSSTLYIGVFSIFSTYQMDGKIGWYALYNRALSTAELSQNFNSNRIRFGV